jgi:molybdopterin-guanine dinucleotide biosynthesis protein A
MALEVGWWAQLEAALGPAHRAAAFRDEVRWHPLVGLYHTDVLATVEGLMGRGERALWRLLEASPASAVAPPEGWRGASGVNTLADLK